MNTNPHLSVYSQDDIQQLYISGSIALNIDENSNLTIQNITGQLYSSSILIPLENAIFISGKVEANYDTSFTQL